MTIEFIEKTICQMDNIKPEELHIGGPGKKQRGSARARQAIIYFAVKYGFTLAVAGSYFGFKHDYAIYCRNKINDLMMYDKCFAERMKSYEARLTGDSIVDKTIMLKQAISELKNEVAELYQKVNKL